MTEPNVPDQSEVFREIASGFDAGLPAFQKIQIEFDSTADLRRWAAQFDIKLPPMTGQPYPDLADPYASDRWLISTFQTWRGMKVHLTATDPITDEQRKHWVESGWAARMAAHNDSAGLSYSREPDEVDDPRPVSPARGGQPHVVAVTNDGLVDETPAEPRCSLVNGQLSTCYCTGRPGCQREDDEQDEAEPLPTEAATLTAALHFSAARREAAQLTGRTTPEHLRTATLDLLHEQASAEDAERAWRLDVREGEHGRITSPDLAHFLAKKEDARRAAAETVHYLDFGSDGEDDDRLTCGKQVREVSQFTDNFASVTCPVCTAAMLPVSESR